MDLPVLNFAEKFGFKFRQDKDKFFIYDLTRKQWLLLTPEEWVRQHWIQYFLVSKGYSASALISERKIMLNGLTKRLDLLITEKTQPKILVECKAPQIKLTEKTFEQIARYNSVVGAEQLILSNGIQHIFSNHTDGEYQFFDVNF